MALTTDTDGFQTKALYVPFTIWRMVERRRIALLLLAEENDQTAYLQWLPAHGILYRSMDESVFLDAVRRVARGELYVQNRSSDMSDDAPDVAWRSEDFLPNLS